MDYLRYPLLFAHASDDTKTNGLGALCDIVGQPSITNTKNTISTINITYKKDGFLHDKIEEGMCILADAAPNLRRQLFRINHIQRSEENLIIEGSQIASDVTNGVIANDISLPSATASEAFQKIQDAVPPMISIPGVTFSTDITETANINWLMESNAEVSSLLLGDDAIGDTPTQSMQALYRGNWIFDNYNFKLLRNAGRKTGIVIKAGRDLTSVNQDINTTEMYAGILPFAKYTPNPPKKIPDDISQAGEEYEGVGVVQYLGAGTLTTYDSPYPGHTVAGSVKNSQRLNILRKLDGNSDPAPMNDDDWYMLDDLTWIDASFITFDKSGSYVINNVQGQGHTTVGSSSGKGIKYPAKGTATVTYDDNGQKIHVYKSPFQGPDHKKTGETLKNGQKISYDYIAVDENGNKWYRIGHQKWLYGPHLSFSKKGDHVYQPAKGKVYVKKDAIWYSSPGKKIKIKVAVTHKPAKNSKHPPKVTYKDDYKRIKEGYYKVLSQAVDAGTTYYHIGSSEWVSSSNCDWHAKKAVKPKPPKDYVNHEATTDGHIELHDKPSSSSALNDSIPAGVSVSVIGTADANGENWTQVSYNGHTGWVLSSHLSYKADDDVEPTNTDEDDSDDDEEQPQQEIIVMLPDKVIIADNCLGMESPRIQFWDASQYWTPDNDNDTGAPTDDDIQQLRDLAESYMEEYRIGQPAVSLTLSYEQINQIDEINLYDEVGVEFDDLGIQETAEVTSTVFDCQAHEYQSITIGSLPINYTHELLQSANDNTEGQVGQVSNRQKITASMTSRIHKMLNEEGADKEAAIKQIEKDLGISLPSKTFEEAAKAYDQAQKEIGDVIKSGGSAELRFVDINGKQTYDHPVKMCARNEDGSTLSFNSIGIGYFDPSGSLVAGFDDQGKLLAESINGITINAIKINGALEANSNGVTTTVGGLQDNLPLVFQGQGITDGIVVSNGTDGVAICPGEIYVARNNEVDTLIRAEDQIMTPQINAAKGVIGHFMISGNEITNIYTGSTVLEQKEGIGDNSIQSWVGRHWKGNKSNWDFL
ncbi:phage tail spike protein [Lactobacillus sp. ESL0677]|uniref:phage tail spike protein n=1 Tax=Lactobacillus sp. ESL0677 TaxID=2983208 RepID=UPI0023F64A7C|nr:phage tail spike protein [Lactobacillus sp. ESL0677]WEV36210.1 SH3 domain-containing protein [Lactobacillus sp. ESL0677]